MGIGITSMTGGSGGISAICAAVIEQRFRCIDATFMPKPRGKRLCWLSPLPAIVDGKSAASTHSNT
ncbi:MAG: hypothetical protein R3C26_17970 [Calditrichia bacterium]